MAERDRWARWLLETRFAGDAELAAESMKRLHEVRNEVLARAGLHEGETLLDVGAGDGLIAFGALDRLGVTGRVILSDISEPLLEHAEALAVERGVRDRCRFVKAAAESLAPVPDQSVDVVTTRSVLIFVADKPAALREFYRVLKPGGRFSLFEPINRFGLDEFAYDVTPVHDLALKVRAFYRRLQPPASDPMLNFDERDLVRLCEATGFVEIHLTLHLIVRPAGPRKWETVLAAPGNPNIPPLGEALAAALTPEEAARYEAHLRPLVEAGRGTIREAGAFLKATRP